MTSYRFTKVVFFIFFWWSVLTPNFINIFGGPQIISWIDELLQLILFTSWFVTIVFSHRDIVIDLKFQYAGVLFFGVVFISFLYNGTSLFDFIQFIIIYLRPIFMILLAATIFKVQDVPFIVKNIALLFTIQLILNISWTLGINPIPHYKIFIDINTGTFESVAPVAYFCVLIIFYLVGLLPKTKRRERNRYLIYVVLVISLLQLYFTFTTHAILLGIVSLLGLILINKKFIYYVGLSITILVILITTFSSWEKQNFHGSTAELLSPENLLTDRFERLQNSIKFASLYLVTTGNIPEIKSPLLGAGPGMYGSIVASRDSKLYKKYNDTEKLREAGLEIRDTTSVTGGAVSGYLAIMGDLGWLGFGIYMYINMLVFLKLLVYVRSQKHNQSSHPEIFTALIPALIFYFILDLIWDMGAFKIMSIGFWIWVGIALREMHHSSDSKIFKLVLGKRYDS